MTYPFSSPGNPVPAVLRGGLLACGLLAAAAGVHAGEVPAAQSPGWKFSGFGTLGAVHASTRSADFTSSVLHANGAGYSERWSPDVDSRLGAQLDLSMGRWSGVLQVVSEQDLEGSYRPRVEWANIKYQVSPDLALRIGRIALPVFMAADYRKVGYTMPWVRPPVEVYGALPVSSSDGVDATWRWSSGDVRHATQGFLGGTDTRLLPGLRLQAHGIAGLSHSIERGALSARMSVLTAHLTTGIGAELFSALRGFGAPGAVLAERYAIDDKRVSIVSAGFSYDPGQWFLGAEAGRSHSRSLLGSTSTVYAGGGYRFGGLTPYLGYATVRAHGATSSEGLPLASLPAPVRPTAAFLNAGLNTYLSTIPVQSTVSAGLRWDLVTDAALKFQYDRVRPADGSRGTLINQQAGFRSGRAVHLASVALDFVF